MGRGLLTSTKREGWPRGHLCFSLNAQPGPPATSCLSGLSGPVGPRGAPEPRWVAVDGLATRRSRGPWGMATAEQ